MSESPTTRNTGSSITRALDIIEAVVQADHALSPADLSHLLDIPKPSVHRLLQQMQSEGYLQTNMRGGIVPNNRLHKIAMGVIYAARHKAQRQAILRQLCESIDETCGIAMPDGIDMVYYDRVQSSWPLQLHLPVGAHVPMWCTASGKLYLSSFTKPRRTQIIENLALKRMARNTITDASALERELKRVRQLDVGIDNEEFVDGMVACAVPVNSEGRLIACLFTHAPTIRKSLEQLLEFVPAMRLAAEQLRVLIEEPTEQD
jgi:IclR family transcriptional regulator, acetate operon repressor